MKLYVVRNQEGKYFRSKGFGGYGQSWVSDLASAKFYAKIGQAKSRCTYWYKTFPGYGCPDLIEIDIDSVPRIVIPMKETCDKSIQKGKIREAREEENRRQYKLEAAQRSLEDAKKRVAALKRS
jgi:hypothetical protein